VAEHASAPVPPDHGTVISRALCLGALLVRGTIESAIQLSPTPEDAEAYRALSHRLSVWLNEQDFTALFTANELEALSQHSGSWTGAEHEAHAARVEGLGVLLWALSYQDRMPSVNQQGPLPDLEALLGWPASANVNPNTPRLDSFPRNGASLLASPGLRTPAVIKGERVSAECWNWRTQVAALQRTNTPPPNGQPYELMVAIAAEEAHTASAIGRPVMNDFSLAGRPFGVLPEIEQLKIARIVSARRVALLWLTGYATEWDYIPVRAATPEPVAA
jgi:hypothetical protein